MLRFATINARSLRNKVAVFSDYIVDQNIDTQQVLQAFVSLDIHLNHFPVNLTDQEEAQA